MRKPLLIALIAALSAATASAIAMIPANRAAETFDGFKLAADASGTIRVPEIDYRRTWVQLGTFSVAGEKPGEGTKQLHVTYAPAKAVAGYRLNGRFPDGSVLIKDVFAATTEKLPTGLASYAAKLDGRFVMIKNMEGRFTGHPLWGDGWGWAFFEGEEKRKTVTKDYKKDCIPCHVPAKATDWLYVQGYPALADD